MLVKENVVKRRKRVNGMFFVQRERQPVYRDQYSCKESITHGLKADIYNNSVPLSNRKKVAQYHMNFDFSVIYSSYLPRLLPEGRWNKLLPLQGTRS